MIGKRGRFYLTSSLLAVPPVVLAGMFCNNLVPQPEKVPAVVSANDPEVGLVPHQDARVRTLVQVATRQH